MLSLTYDCPYVGYSDATGYDLSLYPVNEVTVVGNDDVAIQAAIDSLGAAGGIVNIPDGIYLLEDTLFLKDNVHLKGESQNGTILRDDDSIGTMLYTKHADNFGISNLTIDGNNQATRGFLGWYGSDVLIYNVTAENILGNGLQLRYIDGATVYNSISQNNTGHGINSDSNQSGDHSDAGAQAEFNSDYQGYGVLWDRNFLIIDNIFDGNGDSGFDLHIRDSQISCNITQNNSVQGGKTQDLQNSWVDHNTFINNGNLFYRISQEHLGSLPGALGDNVIWANDFTGETGLIIRLDDTVNTYLVCNIYGNVNDLIDVENGTIYYHESDSMDAALYDDEVDHNGPLQVSTNYAYLKTETPNNPPVLDPIADRTNTVGDSVSFTPTASDVDMDTLTWSSSGLPTGLSINTSTGLISGSTSAAGTFNVSVTVNDGNGGTDTENFVWTVNAAPNTPPNVNSISTQTTTVGNPVSLQVNATDVDMDTLLYNAMNLPTGTSINTSTGLISGTPNTVGTYNVTIVVDDGNGGMDSTSFTWNVTESATGNKCFVRMNN